MFRAAAKTTLFLAAAVLYFHPAATLADPPPPAAFPDTQDPRPALARPTSRPATRPAIVYKQMRGTAGYWRLAQTADGVWWFVAPDGRREFLNAVTTVQPFQPGRDGAAEFLSCDYDSEAADEAARLEAWATRTSARVRQIGFKSLGAWCNPALHKTDLPITRDLNILAYMSGHGLRFYSAQWPAIAETAVRDQVEPLKENRQLVGYYTDNELDWSDSAIGPGAHFDHLPADDPNRLQVLKVIRSVWSDLASFNTAWKSDAAEWDDLHAWKTLPRAQQSAYKRLCSAWLSQLAGDYFRFTTELVKKYDPNHLILGVRFKATAPAEVVRASRGLIDAHSINLYPGDARLDRAMLGQLHENAGLPVIISEYSFHSLDGRSGNRNTFGFGAQVPDQQARADGYRLFTSRLARVPYVVGADWFQWMDEPPSGRTADGEDVNFGVVDIDDRPYELLARAIAKTTPTLNPLHEASYRDSQDDVWREPLALPTFRVPFLDKAPRLNGELSDWPIEARLPGVRIAGTIGAERHKLPVPNLMLGWTPDGLYVGMEVFDNDIQAADPRGAWWTRDAAELFISTRPGSADQEAYDRYCHQFFFLPLDAPFAGHYVGVVGQWHREGDALDRNLLPHPLVRESARIAADRYVVEMLIPTKALNGFDPATTRKLGFNLNVRNYQHATDYYWSAPKDVQTQLRPGTWGKLELAEPAAPLLATPATQPTVAGSQ